MHIWKCLMTRKAGKAYIVTVSLFKQKLLETCPELFHHPLSTGETPPLLKFAYTICSRISPVSNRISISFALRISMIFALSPHFMTRSSSMCSSRNLAVRPSGLTTPFFRSVSLTCSLTLPSSNRTSRSVDPRSAMISAV